MKFMIDGQLIIAGNEEQAIKAFIESKGVPEEIAINGLPVKWDINVKFNLKEVLDKKGIKVEGDIKELLERFPYLFDIDMKDIRISYDKVEEKLTLYDGKLSNANIEKMWLVNMELNEVKLKDCVVIECTCNNCEYDNVEMVDCLILN